MQNAYAVLRKMHTVVYIKPIYAFLLIMRGWSNKMLVHCLLFCMVVGQSEMIWLSVFMKITISDNDKPEKIYLNRTIEDMKLSNLQSYTKFLSQANKYMEDKKMINNFINA
uniref:Uncharacterized protein n=1 Tax=Strongyloides venezuelensis TaxID=75913 RepID=A0A0K0FHG2_STRVS